MRTKMVSIFALLAFLTMAGCRYWLGPNNVNIKGLARRHDIDVNDRGDIMYAGRLSGTYSPEYQEIHFKNLQRNTTYCFWLSRKIQNWHGGIPNFVLPDAQDQESHKKLEITLTDKNGNELKYNDEYTENPENDYDTIAFIRYRTNGIPDYKEVYLKISMCEGPLEGLSHPFDVNVTAYKSPQYLAQRYQHGGIPATAYRTDVDPIQRNISIPVKWNKITHQGHGHAYAVWKEWCADRQRVGDDNLECMLHNFQAYWFIPDTTDFYEVKLLSHGTLNNGFAFPESLALSVFHDSQFRRPASTDINVVDDSVKLRGVAICDDTGTGIRMYGSGKHLSGTANVIFAGEANNEKQGISMMKDSVYYFLVSAPKGYFPKCTLKLSHKPYVCSNPAPNTTINYSFPCSLVTKLGESPTGSAQSNLSESELSRVGMELQWHKYCWYDISASNANAYQFEINSTFRGKVSIYSYGDPGDLSTYQHVKSRLFGFPNQDQVIKFDISGNICHRALKAVVYGSPCDANNAISINMVPAILPSEPCEEPNIQSIRRIIFRASSR